MSGTRAAKPMSGRFVALVLVTALAAGPSSVVLADDDKATLRGSLLDPSGLPATGFKAVIENVDTRKEFLSTTSDENGEYTVDVPVGQRYRIVAAISPDGDRLPVKASAPMPVRVPGSYRLPDVLFQQEDDDPGAAVPPSDRPPAVAAQPWYKKPGGIVGITVGSIAFIAFLTDGDGNPLRGSPSTPVGGN